MTLIASKELDWNWIDQHIYIYLLFIPFLYTYHDRSNLGKFITRKSFWLVFTVTGENDPRHIIFLGNGILWSSPLPQQWPILVIAVKPFLEFLTFLQLKILLLLPSQTIYLFNNFSQQISHAQFLLFLTIKVLSN